MLLLPEYLYYYRYRHNGSLNSNPTKIFEDFVDNVKYISNSDKYKNNSLFLRSIQNMTYIDFMRNYIRLRKELLDTDNELKSNTIKKQMDKLLELRKEITFYPTIYKHYAVSSLVYILRCLMFKYSPKLLLFYDNPKNEFKLFVNRLFKRCDC